MLRRLDPSLICDQWLLHEAWEITQAREEWYGEMGAGDDFEAYLAGAHARGRADFALVDGDNHLITLITVDLTGHKQYSINLTSRPNAPCSLVRNAVYTVGANLFIKLEAQEVWTKIPSFHRASRRLTQACGLRPNGEDLSSSATFRGRPLRLIRYSLDRDTFLKEHSANGQTPIRREANLSTVHPD